MSHFVTITEASADAIDSYAARPFCETCSWAGEWHHADTLVYDLDEQQAAEGEAFDAANDEGNGHVTDTA
jgi:hypothetical protein